MCFSHIKFKFLKFSISLFIAVYDICLNVVKLIIIFFLIILKMYHRYKEINLSSHFVKDYNGRKK